MFNLLNSTAKQGSLVDRGAKGGIAGSDTRLIQGTGRCVDVAGIDDHQLKNIPVGSCGGVIPLWRLSEQCTNMPSVARVM